MRRTDSLRIVSPKSLEHAANIDANEFLQGIVPIRCISRGGYGSILLCRKESTGDLFAVKVMTKSDRNREAFLNERRIMSCVDSPFLAQLYFAAVSNKYYFLVMEYVPGGDCFSLLQRAGYLEEDHARLFLAETVLAIQNLHERGIVHRDIKPDNVSLFIL